MRSRRSMSQVPAEARRYIQPIHRDLAVVEGGLAGVDSRVSQLDRQVKAAQKAVDDLIASGAQPAIIADAKKTLEARVAALEATQVVFSQRLTDAEGTLVKHGGRLDAHDLKFASHHQRIEGVEVRSNAHATAIAALQDANGWIPIAAAAVAGVITYVVIELFRSETAAHIQWAWTIGIAAIVGIVATLLTGNRQQMTSRVSAGASASAGVPPISPSVTDVPPAPPVQPRPTTQQSVAGTRAAASAASQASSS